MLDIGFDLHIWMLVLLCSYHNCALVLVSMIRKSCYLFLFCKKPTVKKFWMLKETSVFYKLKNLKTVEIEKLHHVLYCETFGINTKHDCGRLVMCLCVKLTRDQLHWLVLVSVTLESPGNFRWEIASGRLTCEHVSEARAWLKSQVGASQSAVLLHGLCFRSLPWAPVLTSVSDGL